MSKRFDTSGMYPGKRNPGGSPTTGRTNNTPQGKAGETPVQVPARPGTVQNRGDRARESYAPPTRTRPTTKPNTTPAQTPASPKPAQTPQPKPAPTPEEVRRNNLNDMNEILGVNSYTGEAEDIAKEEWRRSGVQNAEEYRKVLDYHWRSGVGGIMDTARNAVNDTYYRLQNGRAEQLAEDAVMREMNLHGGDYNELYAKYLKQYREQEKGYQPTKAVDWGEKYNAETARMAEEAGFNDYVRRDGQLYRAIGGMLPALALSAVGNVGGGVMAAKGAYAAAKGAAKIGKVLSASMTFSSASGAAFDNEIAKGTDPETAMKIATLAGVVELGTEAITSGMGRLCGKRLGYGGAAADEMMKRLAARVSSDSAVQNALLYLGGVLGEGFEEFLSEWGNYAANRALGGSDTRTAREVWGDSKESFWDGVFVAGLLNATTLLQSGESPQDAIKQGVDEAVQNPDGVQRTGTGKRTGLKPGEIAGKISDSLRNKLPQRALLQLNETLEQSDAGRRFAEELSGMDADAAAQLTEAVTDAVSDAVKRGEEYSSREDFLTDGSVGRMTEAVLDETLKSFGVADADAAPKGRVTTDPRVAALADMAVDALDERLQTDTALRDAIERGRQRKPTDFRGVDIDEILRRIEQGESYDYLDGISVERRGNTVIFPSEYGIVYPDGKRYPVAVGPYREVRQINRQLGLPDAQAHHVAQNAAYGSIILRSQGIAISVEGDVIKNPDSQHARLHGGYEARLDEYRAAGIMPTNRAYVEIAAQEIQAAGINSAARDYILDQVLRQWKKNGIELENEIPRMPRKMSIGIETTLKGEENDGYGS